MEFDFDAWSRLAKDDPEDFERQRMTVVRAVIAAAPAEHRERLERMQFRLDQERERASSALSSCLQMHSLMWTGFFRLRRELNKLTQAGCEAFEPTSSAQVIPFRRRPEARSDVSDTEH